MFEYSQSTGVLSHDGKAIATGYSGNGSFMNNPESQSIRMHGPIPQGQYTICHPTVHEQLGPVAMELMPYSTNKMFLRSGFFIHGDNAQMNHSGSDGCVVISHDARIAIAGMVLAGDNQLTVVP